MGQAQAGELDHRGVDGVQMSRDVGAGGRPVGIEDVAAAEHVELRQVAGGNAEVDRRLAAGEAVPQHVAVVVVRVRPAEHGRRLELDQVGEPLGQVRFLPREKHFAAAVEVAVGPADLPAVEQVFVEQLRSSPPPAETSRPTFFTACGLVRGSTPAPGTRPVATLRVTLKMSYEKLRPAWRATFVAAQAPAEQRLAGWCPAARAAKSPCESSSVREVVQWKGS